MGDPLRPARGWAMRGAGPRKAIEASDGGSRIDRRRTAWGLPWRVKFARSLQNFLRRRKRLVRQIAVEPPADPPPPLDRVKPGRQRRLDKRARRFEHVRAYTHALRGSEREEALPDKPFEFRRDRKSTRLNSSHVS